MVGVEITNGPRSLDRLASLCVALPVLLSPCSNNSHARAKGSVLMVAITVSYRVLEKEVGSLQLTKTDSASNPIY